MTTKETERLKIGDEIYYTGDMANSDGFGEIADTKDGHWSAELLIKMDDGRKFWVGRISFADSIGRRFMLKSEWAADRKARIDAFYKAVYNE